jgi:type IV secretory pathway VirB2 component (pilin)
VPALPGGTLPSDGLGAPNAHRPRPARLLRTLAVAETVTLAALLVNLMAATHSPALAAVVGPLHGALYLAGVLLTWTAPFARWVKIIAVVPVAGVWLAVARNDRERRSGPAVT